MSILDYAKDLFLKPEKYLKFWVALATASLAVLTDYFPDAQWVQATIGFAGAFGVFMTPNKREK